MQGVQIHLSQSLRRVQQFMTGHADAVQPANAGDARKQLDSAIVALDAASAEQGTCHREVRGEVNRRRQLETALIRKFLTPLAKFARASLVGVPDYAALTPSVKQFQRERLVQAARSMAAAADKYATALTQAKFPANFLAQLRAAADSVQASLDTRSAKVVAGAGATTKVKTMAAQGRRAVAALDSLVSHLILGDERLEREWRAAKRVRRQGTAEVVAASEPAGTIVTVRTLAGASSIAETQEVKTVAA